ncbi:M56 family metallopeptidase [Nannocystis bainbridge]|uniref:M56 family metallopeptidase n=1 Tax=Nannocystis bainbridge TaxID=2995303 RepID=A0ABT5E6J4_9BACT|nr:M56 family metallopeptidase [Nannocystis bainbridge]MDC0721305.1 M56 family metallopeptidase [Nannocystis bainbridge]
MTAALAFLGVVMLHATWAGFAAAGVAAIALRRLGAARSRRRYAVALAALLAVPAVAVLCAAAPRLAAEPDAVSAALAGLAAPTSDSLAGLAASASDSLAGLAATASSSLIPASLAGLAPPAYSLAPATPWLGLAWLLGTAWGLLGLAVASAHLARLRRRARPLPRAHAERLLARARGQLDYAGAIDLVISPDVGVPTVLGWRRPLCALPAAALTAWPGDDLEWLLVHELAHVRRADIAWGWAQNLVEAALFFHPGARWLSRQVRHERECCCDAAVLARPDALVPYVRALARLATADRAAIGPALSATGGTLVSRIERLVDPTLPLPACSRSLCLALVLAAFAGAGALAACETEEADTAPTRPTAEPLVAPPTPAESPAAKPESEAPIGTPIPSDIDRYPIPFIEPPEGEEEIDTGC